MIFLHTLVLSLTCGDLKTQFQSSECCGKNDTTQIPSLPVQFNDYVASEFTARGLYQDLLPQQSAEQLGYMMCKGQVTGLEESWGVILHDMYQTYLHRHPTIPEYEEVFHPDCTLKELGGVEKAQERILKKMRTKLGLDMGTQLAGKKVLVTGGSRGIGFALSVLASEMGATVMTLSRSKDWYEWTKSAATGDNSPWSTPYFLSPTTSNVSEAAAAWNVPVDTLTNCTECPLYQKVRYLKGSTPFYKLPQQALPFYFGLTGINESTFDRIHHFQVDVRSRAQLQTLLDVHLSAVFGTDDSMPDYIFYNAATESSFSTVPGYSADALDLYDHSFNDNVNDTIARTPHVRYNTAGVATPRTDYEVGVGTFLSMLRAKFGEPIKQGCTHVFSSSVAASTALLFGNVEGVPPLGLMFDSTYAAHYGMMKYQGLHLFANLREEGWRTASFLIGTNNGMVNYQWVHNQLFLLENLEAIPSGTTGTWEEMPMAIDRIDNTGATSENGYWISGMTSNGYQMYHSLAAGGYAKGGWTVSTWSSAMRMLKNMLQWPTGPAVCWPRGFSLENKQDVALVLGSFTSGELNNFGPVTAEPINVWLGPYLQNHVNLDFSRTSAATGAFLANHIMLAGQTHYTEEMTSFLSGGNKNKNCNSLWAYDYEFIRD